MISKSVAERLKFALIPLFISLRRRVSGVIQYQFFCLLWFECYSKSVACDETNLMMLLFAGQTGSNAIFSRGSMWAVIAIITLSVRGNQNLFVSHQSYACLAEARGWWIRLMLFTLQKHWRLSGHVFICPKKFVNLTTFSPGGDSVKLSFLPFL
jgi:hypothetical protein